jgi:hypothetical protein
MVELKTAEQVIQFMTGGEISLSRFDEKFLSSLNTCTRVTTNQVELFYKLLYKYARQLTKHNLDVEVLLHLPWTLPVVESAPAYTHGHIEIIDDKITFRCPFNRNFINDFRKEEFNTFLWDNTKRMYESAFTPYALKILLDVGSKHYKNINYCPITTQLIESLYPYSKVSCWDPTLVNINGNLMIASTNEIIDDLIKDIPLSTDPLILAKLASYGIMVHENVHQHDEFLKFASTFENTIEVNNAINIIDWLIDLECDIVYFSGVSTMNPIKSDLIKHLMLNNIAYHDVSTWGAKTPSPTKYNFPVLFRFRTNFTTEFDPYRVAKIVKFVNSNPITIK